MSTPSFDYAIVGAGAAGLHLAIQFAGESNLRNKRILIIDKDPKESNDRTWSFWEKGKSRWDDIAIKHWDKAVFHSSTDSYKIPFDNYRYKTVRSSDFYASAKEIIEEAGFTWIKDEVTEVNDHKIIGKQGTYQADHIFDSRIPPAFFTSKNKHPSLIQHFMGWFIETPEPLFNDSEITIMDYRVKWKDQTSFNYVLPFTSHTALVEFTLFNQTLLTENQYEEILDDYISNTLGIQNFKILEKEQGQIPMSAYPFKKHHTKNITKIGTAGGWVRPSSGYSFKNAERYSQMITKNLVKKRSPKKGVAINRFRFYDRIFLKVLIERNDLGEVIFETLYTKQPIQSLFRFLDEESSLLEDINIMFSLDQPIFRKALWQSFRH